MSEPQIQAVLITHNKCIPITLSANRYSRTREINNLLACCLFEQLPIEISDCNCIVYADELGWITKSNHPFVNTILANAEDSPKPWKIYGNALVVGGLDGDYEDTSMSASAVTKLISISNAQTF